MAEPRSTMIDPPIEILLEKTISKFTLVTLSSKRARQINSYFNQLGEGLGAIVPPQVTSVARKPLSIALEEIAAGKVRPGELIDDPEDEPSLELIEGEGGDETEPPEAN
jgi:DNA-directed RNA polymerase subunit omega